MPIQVDPTSPPQGGLNQGEGPSKRAIALITYDRKDYFEKVLQSICSQSICGASIFDQYDFYIFQDGLSDLNNPNKSEYVAIAELATKSPNVKQFFSQENNLGVARHFAYVEDYLFNCLQYDFVVFCEDDMVLGDAYMATLHAMAEKFSDDERVAMISAHSQAFKTPSAEQASRKQEYLPMGHSWGYGLYRRAWQSIKPILDIYLELLGSTPYQQRNHTIIQFWQQQCGFQVGATSQDYIKSCALIALGYLRLSSYPNYGFYIGEKGVHFNAQTYAKHRYADTIVFDQPVVEPLPIDVNSYRKLWGPMATQCLEDSESFNVEAFRALIKDGLPKPVFPVNLYTSLSTAEDVIALDKLLFNRYPQNQQKIDERIGLPMDQLFRDSIATSEFLGQHQNWSAIIMLARKIMQEYEKEQKKSDDLPAQ